VVEVEPRIRAAGAPDGFDRDREAIVAVRALAGMRVRKSGARIVAADPDAGVMPRDPGLVLRVPANVELVVIRELLEEIDRIDAASRAQRERRAAAPGRVIGDERHARRALRLVVATGHGGDRRRLKVLVPDDRRIAADSDVAWILLRERRAGRRAIARRRADVRGLTCAAPAQRDADQD